VAVTADAVRRMRQAMLGDACALPEVDAQLPRAAGAAVLIDFPS